LRPAQSKDLRLFLLLPLPLLLLLLLLFIKISVILSDQRESKDLRLHFPISQNQQASFSLKAAFSRDFRWSILVCTVHQCKSEAAETGSFTFVQEDSALASNREIDQLPDERCPECGSGFAKDKAGTGFRRHLLKLPKLDPKTKEPMRDDFTGELIMCGGTRQSWGKGNRTL